MLDLLTDILRRCDAGETLAVCTVVRTRGSTPQKAGAVLVVLTSGQTLGTIGGGCVEAEVRSRALRLLAGGGADELHSFKLDHDLGWDDGLVCGGTMDVAVQRLSSAGAIESLRIAVQELTAGRPAELNIAVPTPAGDASFTRRLEPTPRLVIAGAGHVGQALAAIAGPAGFEVTVIDDRADQASAERFPNADRIIGEIDAELRRLPIDGRTFIVIVTRGHHHDASALAAVVQSRAAYVGLIGSKRKIVHIYKDLLGAGVPKAALETVHAPIGLDIGAVAPAEIAVSIAAELIAVRRGRGGTAVESLQLPAELIGRVETGVI